MDLMIAACRWQRNLQIINPYTPFLCGLRELFHSKHKRHRLLSLEVQQVVKPQLLQTRNLLGQL